MKAIILAAGRSTRLGDITKDIPKCLLPFGKTTVLGKQISILSSLGIKKEDIFVVVGYRHEKVRKIHSNLIINEIYEITDNSYSLGLALSKIELEDDILILDGDLIFDKEIIRELINDKRDNIILSKTIEDTKESTGLKVTKDQRVSEIGKHIKGLGYVYISIFKVSAAVVPDFKKELLKGQYRKMWYTIPLSNILKKHFFYNKVVSRRWHEIDTIQDYMEAKQLFGIEKISILLTGASGFLGQKLMSFLSRKYTIFGTTYTKNYPDLIRLDITDKGDVEKVVSGIKPDLIIHTAAISDPDVCKKNKILAENVNYKGTKYIVDICEKLNIKLIFISTDYVFNGSKKAPYREEEVLNPLNLYGKTKALAEEEIKKLKHYLILRVPIFYGFNGSLDKETFISKIIKKLRSDEDIYVDNRQIRRPILIDEIAITITKLLDKEGIIHLSSDESVTKFKWAKIIARTFNFNGGKIQIENNVNLKSRPEYVKLDIRRQKAYGIELSNISDGTRILRQQMNCALRLVYIANPYEYVLGFNVADFRIKLGKLLAKQTKDAKKLADIVVPIPESGLFSAMGYADITSIPFYRGLVRNNYIGRLFYESNKKRHDSTQQKLMPIKELLRNKRVIVIDEAIFTGLTLKIVCDMLKACNVKEIHIRIASPPIIKRCNAYMQPERELLLEQISIENLPSYFGVNSVEFLNYETFTKILPDKKNVCDLCFREKRK